MSSKDCSKLVFLFIILFLIGACNMKKEEDIAVIYGIQKGESVEQLRAFSWPEIVDKINNGEFNNKITWVMNTQEIPSEYNQDELKKKHIENYQKYMRSLLQDRADQ